MGDGSRHYLVRITIRLFSDLTVRWIFGGGGGGGGISRLITRPPNLLVGDLE